MSIKERAKELQYKVPAVYIAMRKKETPILAKILAGFVVIYTLSPVDLIPDFIPILGLVDDIIILPILISFVIKLIPDNIWEECQIEAKNLWLNGKPKKWYYAIPFVVVWLVIIYFIVIIFI